MTDPIEYLNEYFTGRYSPDALVEVPPLPPCQACAKEVKPGEDLCWDCLGEPFPIENESWYVYGQENLGSRIVYSTYPVSIGTSIPATLFFTNTATNLDITGVTNITNSVSYTFNPPITLVNGDSIQIKLSGTIG